jgi:hypothetical protein
METSELPVVETPEAEPAAGTCIENEIDLAALKLWREASVPETQEEAE